VSASLLQRRRPNAEPVGDRAAVDDERLVELVLHLDQFPQAWIEQAERARQERRASGGTARRRDVATVGDLTPQERQTALLVSAGLADRDIAARSFLSPRTVEYHLSNVYSKLGVRSRGELAQLQLS
jgi:DNA-binding NarL/FixJ family response regulator